MSEKVDQDAALPSAFGIIDCLRMLAREAAELDLSATQTAIQQAVDACRSEISAAGAPAPQRRRAVH